LPRLALGLAIADLGRVGRTPPALGGSGFPCDVNLTGFERQFLARKAVESTSQCPHVDRRPYGLCRLCVEMLVRVSVLSECALYLVLL